MSDVLGRFGGDEYIVVLPDTDGAAAMEKMDDIRRNFAAIDHDTGQGSFLGDPQLRCGRVPCSPYEPRADCSCGRNPLPRPSAGGRDRVLLAGKKD